MIFMFNDLLYIYSAMLGERWKGIEMLNSGQQFLQYQENEESQKKTTYKRVYNNLQWVHRKLKDCKPKN